MIFPKIIAATAVIATFISGIMFSLYCDTSFSQTLQNNPTTTPNNANTGSFNTLNSTTPSFGQLQPQLRIDANQLINSQNQKQEKKLPPNPNKDYSGAASNNSRIGSNGDYIDNSSSEQITSSGLICKSDRNSKKCN
jgi:hypothetical protein